MAPLKIRTVVSLRMAPPKIRSVIPRGQTPAKVLRRLEAFMGQKKRDTSHLGPEIEVIRNVSDLRKKRGTAKSLGQSVALVPTMGALHPGHLALIRKAARRIPEIYVSIYVNPTQFGVNEDLDRYPKTWEQDMAMLRALNQSMTRAAGYVGKVTTVFKPTTNIMYPGLPPTSEIRGYGSFVNITPLANVLEGASRPVFFRGVATVVMKLLNIVQPDEVVMGLKDIQQVIVIKRMIDDFHINTRLLLAATERSYDGLALSSRNVYLGTRRRRVASVLHRALAASLKPFLAAKRERREIIGPALGIAESLQRAQRQLPPHQRARFEIEYMSLADPVTLKEIETVDMEHGAILSGAIVMLPLEEIQPGENAGLGGGSTPVRLIDNRVFRFNKIFLSEESSVHSEKPIHSSVRSARTFDFAKRSSKASLRLKRFKRHTKDTIESFAEDFAHLSTETSIDGSSKEPSKEHAEARA